MESVKLSLMATGMKAFVASVLLLLALPGIGYAGDYPHFSHMRYWITEAPKLRAYEMTQADLDWQEVLALNLGVLPGPSKHRILTFVKAPYKFKCKDCDGGTVFQNIADTKQLLVLVRAETWYFIDRGTKKIRLPWSGGSSAFPHPDGNFVTVFAYNGYIGGVPVEDWGLDDLELFSGKSVNWW